MYSSITAISHRIRYETLNGYTDLKGVVGTFCSVKNLYDICNHLENNNLIELFYSEKIKFYCEKTMKASIRKLLEEDTVASPSDDK